MRIQTQGFHDQNLKNFTAEKKSCFLSQIAIYLSLGLHP